MQILKENKEMKKVLITEDAVETAIDTPEPTMEVTDGGKTIEADVTINNDETGKGATAADELVIENALTRALDEALTACETHRAMGRKKYNTNVLITGLPGSSKTATVAQWARNNSCNLWYFDVKKDDTPILVSGASAIDRTDPTKPKIRSAYSTGFDRLDTPNSILFLDEFNRQLNPGVRGSLLTLIADRSIAGDTETGFRDFPNLLFTIVAINPKIENDRGVDNLGEAELRRFAYQVNFDSDVATTTEYLNKFYEKEVRQLVAKKDTIPKYDEWLDGLLKALHLGQFLIHHDDFKYTDLVGAAEARRQQGKIVCQSAITEMLANSFGDIDKFRAAINNYSGFYNAGKEMILNILDDYRVPETNKLRKLYGDQWGLDLGAKEVPAEPAKELTGSDEATIEDNEEFDFDSGLEDDTDFSATDFSDSTDSSKVVSDAEAATRLGDFIRGLGR